MVILVTMTPKRLTLVYIAFVAILILTLLGLVLTDTHFKRVVTCPACGTVIDVGR